MSNIRRMIDAADAILIELDFHILLAASGSHAEFPQVD